MKNFLLALTRNEIIGSWMVWRKTCLST